MNPYHEQRLRRIISEYNSNVREHSVEFEVNDSFCDVDYRECIKRDLIRGKEAVGEKVIINMYRKYLHKAPVLIPYKVELPDCILVDVDWTLAIHEYRDPFDYYKCTEDKLNTPIASLINDIQNRHSLSYTMIVTGRENIKYESGVTVWDLTSEWLNKNHIRYDRIFIREEGDHRPDWIVKKEMFEKHIKDKYNVLYVIDDRRQTIDMWRKEGLTVLDVAGHDF